MIDPIPSPKPRTVWAVATSQSVYERIRAIAIARQTSNAKVVAAAIDAFKHTEPRKEPTMPSPNDITNTKADWLAQLEQATYDACGPNVGPEEFDEAAERACEAVNGLKRCNCTASERETRIRKVASEVFGAYINL